MLLEERESDERMYKGSTVITLPIWEVGFVGGEGEGEADLLSTLHLSAVV